MFNAQDMMDLMNENTNLPEWVQSKITLAEDYVSTAANYLRGELNEEVKDDYARKVDKYLKKKYGKDKQPQGADFAAQRRKERLAKNGRMDEDTLEEGRPSQRHPLEGHDYHKKSNAELIGIAKDAHAAAEAMKGHSPQSENKYRDQANDSATVRYFRQKSGMPDWYKKKYGHVKEDVEIQESDAAWAASQEKRKEKKLTHNDQDKLGQVRALMAREKEAKAKMKKEDVELDEENKPTNPELWSKAKSMAKSKFDVYPSAYANGWAAKKYKEMGGDWKSVKEETEKPASRKAQIVKDIMKSKKNQDETSDKYQKDPEISSEIQKN
jgi:hypothetical protein